MVRSTFPKNKIYKIYYVRTIFRNENFEKNIYPIMGRNKFPNQNIKNLRVQTTFNNLKSRKNK